MGLCALMQFGCSGVEDGASRCADYELTTEEAEHACVHVVDGPFDDLRSGEQWSNLHMLYTVALESSGTSYAGELKFVARESAVHAFLAVEEGVSVRVADSSGDLCVVEQAPDGCESFASAHLVLLERGKEVTLAVSSDSSTTVRMLAERQ